MSNPEALSQLDYPFKKENEAENNSEIVLFLIIEINNILTNLKYSKSKSSEEKIEFNNKLSQKIEPIIRRLKAANNKEYLSSLIELLESFKNYIDEKTEKMEEFYNLSKLSETVYPDLATEIFSLKQDLRDLDDNLANLGTEIEALTKYFFDKAKQDKRLN